MPDGIASAPTPPSARAPVVLVANADEWSARSLASVLHGAGYAVLRAYMNGDALDRIRATRPDVIVADLRLPDEGAAALCRRVRESLLATPSTPILVSTPAAISRAETLELLRAGADDILRHPLDGEELILRVGARVRAKFDADREREARVVEEESGLYTLRGLALRAREMGAAAARRHEPLACVMLAAEVVAPGGVRRPVNGAGAALARALHHAGRRSDALARLAPGEFAVVAALGDAAQVERLAVRLAEEVVAAAARTIPRPEGRIMVRGGYELARDFSAADLDASELVARAGAALHDARTSGEGRWLLPFRPSS